MRRRFIDLPDGRGQLHVREHTPLVNGAKVPLVLLHAAPGSALMLEPLQTRFTRHSIAIDLPGMGDSTPLPASDREADIGDFTAPVAAGLSALDFGAFDVYATLSGVRVALELATTTTLPIRKLILDGIGLPKPDQMPDLLEHYAPAFVPDINGGHLLNTFALCRDQYLFYPWYARDAEHRRPGGLPNAAALHTKTMEALKSAAVFRPLIRAAFRYDCAAKLKALKQPALISGDGAAVRPDYPVLTEPPAEPLTATSDNLDKRAAQMNAFLDG
jgi:pimeloyl-ACP methyl ester carboxylesterase